MSTQQDHAETQPVQVAGSNNNIGQARRDHNAETGNENRVDKRRIIVEFPRRRVDRSPKSYRCNAIASRLQTLVALGVQQRIRSLLSTGEGVHLDQMPSQDGVPEGAWWRVLGRVGGEIAVPLSGASGALKGYNSRPGSLDGEELPSSQPAPGAAVNSHKNRTKDSATGIWQGELSHPP